MKRGILSVGFILIAALVSGCLGGSVYNVSRAPVPDGLSETQVEKSIQTAGMKQGWVLKKEAPGHFVGTRTHRDTVAVIDIAYDHRYYSILYKDSRNMDYDGDSIGSEYNGWVKKLQKRIKEELDPDD